MTGGEERDRQAGRAQDALLRVYERTRSGEPPPRLDAAILAEARRALHARTATRRWWVPLAVAATVLLAVSLVIEVGREPAAPQHDTVPIETTEQAAKEAPPARPPEPPAAPTPAIAPTRQQAQPPPPAPAARRAEPVAPPAEEAQETRTLQEREGAPAVQPEAAAARAAAPAAAAVTYAADEAGSLPTPEDWLARIEALEAEGRHADAKRERTRLEQAYPGWLERRAAEPQ